MKSLFSRLGGKSGKSRGNKDIDDNGSDLNVTPQRGLLDRGLSTSSGHAASPAPGDVGGLDPVRTRLHVARDAESERERGRDGEKERDRDRRERKQREARKQKEKERRRAASESTHEIQTPGSPGSVTVGKRSAMVGGTGESTQSQSQRSVAQQSTQQSTHENPQQIEQEYYASLQQAMAASMADTNARQQQQGALPLQSGASTFAFTSIPSTAPALTTVSFLPDTPSEAPDLHVARALAESQFAARQADELQKARDSLFDAAVSKAMEASMSTADYDHLLRDMKMWMIDLDATSDDVVSELSIVRKREREIAGKIERALEKGDTHRLTRLLWEQENLPEVKRRIEALQETIVPVGIASSDLLALRQRILEQYPPIVESQQARDKIIYELFRSLKIGASRGGSGGGRENGGNAGDGPSSSKATSSKSKSTSRNNSDVIKTSEDCQDSADLRLLIVALVDDAKKIPRAPETIVKEAKAMVRNAFKEQQASATIDLSEIHGPSDEDREICRGRGSQDGDSESKTEASSIKSTATEMQSLIKKKTAVDSGEEGGGREGRSGRHQDEGIRASSNREGLQRLRKEEREKENEKERVKQTFRGDIGTKKDIARTTQPKPFNLSKSRAREQAKANYKKDDLPPIRRVPAFFSLTHELLTDKGIVSQSVDWQSREYSIESFSSKYHTVPAPVNVDEFYSEDVHELLSYVKKHARSFGDQLKSAKLPSSSKDGKEEKWYTMVEVAGAVEGLLTACESFLTWKLPERDANSEAISTSCHELKRTVNQTLSIIADTAYAHDTLRVAIKKHRLPWDETLISQVRWDAQHAASIIMQAAIDCAVDQERRRGFMRATQKSVLKPLGQAVIATFSVHQLSGGFGGEAALVCDELVDLCVHYARQLDPKWFRGTKVVKS